VRDDPNGPGRLDETLKVREKSRWRIVGTGAAWGAAAGVVGQRRQNVKAQQKAAQQQQQVAANQQAQLDNYYRAYGACLTGRGYTVN
jgi:nitrous oxide reductase